MFPESYIENTGERIRLYRELDNIREEKLLEKFEKDLSDRFGKIPEQTLELMNALRLRWKAMHLGFSKIILKSNKMFCHFIADDSSLYYNSAVFSGILNYVNRNPKNCLMKNQAGKLVLQIYPIDSVQKANNIFKQMMSN